MDAGQDVGEWESTSTAPVLLEADELACPQGGVSLTRLGPLPPLQMQPDARPIMSHYRALAAQRYGRDVTAGEPAWSTWP